MSARHVYLAVLAAALFGPELMAQTMLPIPLEQTMTTGMVGFSLNQTARLNVLNLNAFPATASTASNCTVQMQFLDPQNNILKQNTVSNLAPQTATSLDLDRKLVTAQTSLRAQLRGAVIVNPPPVTAGSSTTPVAQGYCTVMVTLEVFDDTTGSTVLLTSDTRTINVGIVPLMMQ
jgi:hypothetical protein